MMWDWKYRNDPIMKKRFKQEMGMYSLINSGLNESNPSGLSMNGFYQMLGMRSLEDPDGSNIQHALGWTPVIITSIDKVGGHAMVVVGETNGQYNVINPSKQMWVSFGGAGPNKSKAGTVELEKSDVEKKLGKFIWYW